MADFLQINTGVVRVPVRDPYGVESKLRFNPTDAGFRQRFFEMAAGIEAKKDELEAKEKVLNEKYPDKTQDAELAELAEYTELEAEICTFCEESIDAVFGEGTCKQVFGGDRVVFAYPKFLEAVAPFVKESADGVMDEYMQGKKNRQQRRAKK